MWAAVFWPRCPPKPTSAALRSASTWKSTCGRGLGAHRGPYADDPPGGGHDRGVALVESMHGAGSPQAQKISTPSSPPGKQEEGGYEDRRCSHPANIQNKQVPALKVGVKFCGHCAPHGYGGTLQNAAGAGARVGLWLLCQRPRVDVLLILNACQPNAPAVLISRGQ